MARPSKLTKTVVKKLEDAFVLGANVEEACFNAGISKQTYYNWQDENEELFDRFEQLKLSPVLKARRTVVEALETDHRFALKYLERKKKDEFSPYEKDSIPTNQDIVIEIGGDEDDI